MNNHHQEDLTLRIQNLKKALKVLETLANSKHKVDILAEILAQFLAKILAMFENVEQRLKELEKKYE